MTGNTHGTAAVLGGSGFVGASIVQALKERGWRVRVVTAPRLHVAAGLVAGVGLPDPFTDEVIALASELAGVDVLVNAAGDPNASSGDLGCLMGPNAALPVVALRAARGAGVSRFVHVSSSVVQGDRAALDSSSSMRAFSPYSTSKVAGERWLLEEPSNPVQVVIYRPPSVHAPGRGVTEKIASLAASPLSSVAGSGDQPTPQALLPNVSDAVAFLATTSQVPPRIVHHPWEGLTTADLLKALGGKDPHHIPTAIARSAIRLARSCERFIPALAPNRRRVELLWLGQRVDVSWLEAAGWTPPHGREAWAGLSRRA